MGAPLSLTGLLDSSPAYSFAVRVTTHPLDLGVAYLESTTDGSTWSPVESWQATGRGQPIMQALSPGGSSPTWWWSGGWPASTGS